MGAKPPLSVLVSVTAISGLAAGYFTWNLLPRSGSAASAARSKPAPEFAPIRSKALPPAGSSMMIVQEPGGRSDEVVALGADDPVMERGKARKAAPEPQAVENDPPAAPAQGVPIIHVQYKDMSSPFHDEPIGHEFAPTQLAQEPFQKEQPPPEAPLQAPPPAPSAPAKARVLAAPRSLNDHPIGQDDLFPLPETPPEIAKPFWDLERKQKALLSGLIAACGAIYLLTSMGVFYSLVGNPSRENAREPEH